MTGEIAFSRLFQGPLGSHLNYMRHIAFNNYREYMEAKQLNHESRDSTTQAKYQELRLFLNAVESLNNIPEYLYAEHKGAAPEEALKKFKKALHAKVTPIHELADLANAYKHCVPFVRRKGGSKPHGVPRKKASDLHRVTVHIGINANDSRRFITGVDFLGPLPEHEAILNTAFEFWLRYFNVPTPEELLNL